MPEQLNDSEVLNRAAALSKKLDERGKGYQLREDYYSGDCPLPPQIQAAKVTKAYKMLMAMTQTSYARLIVRAGASRMEVGGIRTGSEDADKAAWGIWQDNHMDSESRLAQDAVLTHGRAFALIDDPRYIALDTETPRITIEDSATAIVEYREGSRFERKAALRRWKDDDDRWFAALYMPEGIYKLQAKETKRAAPAIRSGSWERLEEDEEWPILYRDEEAGTIPVVEIATNKRLKSGGYGNAKGDIEDHFALIDRINVLKFLRMVIAFTSGFPIRVVIGGEILQDDDGNDIAPFELAADVVAQLEDPSIKVEELKASDIKGFGESIQEDIEELAGVSMTPAYYLRSVPIQNVAADAIRASDAPLNARVADHKPQVGEGWEDMLRVASAMIGVEVPQRAELRWVNREYRSLAERADAAAKAGDILPWQVIAEKFFDATQEEINRWQTLRTSEALNGLLAPQGEPTARGGAQ